MSVVEIISLIAMLLVSGGFASVFTQALRRPNWSSRITSIVAGVVAALVGLATMWLGGQVSGLIESWGALSAQEVWVFLGGTWAASLAWYQLILRNLTSMERLEQWPSSAPKVGLND